MVDAGELKNQVFYIIQDKDSNFKNNEQYSFACGVALNAILFSKDCDDNVNNSILDELQAYKESKDILKIVSDIIEANTGYIEHLPQYKRNLFKLVLNYVPANFFSVDEFRQYMNLGLGNSVFYFESAPVTITEYAQMHNVTPNAIRYHINKNKLTTFIKLNKKIFIEASEPYPAKNKKK